MLCDCVSIQTAWHFECHPLFRQLTLMNGLLPKHQLFPALKCWEIEPPSPAVSPELQLCENLVFTWRITCELPRIWRIPLQFLVVQGSPLQFPFLTLLSHPVITVAIEKGSTVAVSLAAQWMSSTSVLGRILCLMSFHGKQCPCPHAPPRATLTHTQAE